MKKLAEQLLPLSVIQKYNYSLIDFAALVCKHDNPNCSDCLLFKYCANPGSRI